MSWRRVIRELVHNRIISSEEHTLLRGLALCLLILVVTVPIVSFAATKSELQSKIDQRNKDIQSLVIEIQEYQKQINTLDSQASSLSSVIKSLDLTQKKLAADIKLTENKIEAKNLQIEELGTQIAGKEESIEDDRRIIAGSLSKMDQLDNDSLVELSLSKRSISDALNILNELEVLQSEIVSRINDLRAVKADLESNKKATIAAKAELMTLNKQLKSQRQVVLSTQSEKNQLLKETKQSESQYQKLLSQKQALKASFEQEINQYEAQLKTTVDVSKLPHTGSGVLMWPVAQVKITQYFGYTDFATANPQVYNGTGHNGIDLRASIGTPITSAMSGVVSGMGNTDLFRGCYSYGKWVMIKHPNGLSTLYAHLSLPQVSVGQNVSTGDLVGYSGNTGYTTGPHLHFGVYATEGMQLKTLTNSRNCNGAVIPVASFNAYLNPLSYL